MKKIKKTLERLFFALSLLCKHEKGKNYLIVKLILTIVNPLIGLIGVIVPGLIIDELTGDTNISYLIYLIALITLIPFLWGIVRKSINLYLTKKRYDIDRCLEAEFCKHLTLMDYDTFEKPDLMDLSNRSYEVAVNDISGSADRLCSIVSSVVNFVSVVSIVTTFNFIVICVLLLNVLFNFYISKIMKEKKIQHDEQWHKRWMKKWVHTYIVNSKLYADIVRLFNLGDFVINKIKIASEENDTDEFEMDKSDFKAKCGYGLVDFIQNATLYVYSAYAVISGVISVGRMSILISAANQVSSSINAITDSYLTISQNGVKIQKYIDFMNIRPKLRESGKLSPVFDENSVIEFKNVTFSYPGSDRLILNNFNIKISANEKLGIVGSNGCGKSTFVKLLTRLYTPNSGEILLNGINIFYYDYDEYLKLFAPVLQECDIFDMSIKDNTVLNNDFNREKLYETLNLCGLESLLKKLDKGFDTQIGKNIDSSGIELSGGEAQRLAIARAQYRGGSVYILDEPTAALDPNAEIEIYSQFYNLMKGKCAILITHRLSAVQLVDKVAVFEDGHVVEYGTHKELYAKGGIYTEMFDKQAQFYRDGQVEETEPDTAV